MAKSPDQIASNWLSGINNSATKTQQGVDAVAVAPGELAAAAEDRWAAGVQKAKESGKFRNNVASVSKATWQQRMKTKGIPRMADGAAQAKALVTEFHRQHQPVADASSDAAKQEKAQGVSGKQRMNNNFDRMSGFTFIRPRM